MPDALELLKTRRSLKPVELTEPGPSAGRDRHAADGRIARAGPRQAHALAVHRVRGRGEGCRRRGDRGCLPRQISRVQARACGAGAQAPRPRAAGDRGGEPRRPAREDPGMGAGAVRRRRRHELRARPRMRSATAPTGSPNGMPTTAVRSTRWASRRTRRSPASFISARRSSPPEDRPRPPLSEIATRFQ